jgi:hypothetical protein
MPFTSHGRICVLDILWPFCLLTWNVCLQVIRMKCQYMLLETKVEIKLVKLETILWIQLEVNKAESNVKLKVGLSI